jgi:hypothetical protein
MIKVLIKESHREEVGPKEENKQTKSHGESKLKIFL